MSIFEHIPENLFSPLATSRKEIYVDLLFIVYDQHKRTIHTLDREGVVDLFTEYMEERKDVLKDILIDDNSFENNSQNNSTNNSQKKSQEQIGAIGAIDKVDEEDEIKEKNAREKAQIFLRRLIDFGWFIQEQNHDYTFRISLPDYSFFLLESLEKIKSGYRMEFQGKVLTVYQNLTGEDGSSYTAIHQAKEITEGLMNGLKSLNHSIKLYTEKLLKTQKPREIIEQILVDYYEEILGDQYYRLKTSEHISKYRAGILKKVRDLKHNRGEIINQAELMVRGKYANNRVEGENMLYDWLEFIEENFQDMDDILGEIDNRNRRYVTSALQRLEFQMAGKNKSQEKIKEALKHLASLAKNQGEKVESPEVINNLIHLYPQQTVNDNSPKNPPKERKEHKPTPVMAKKINKKSRDKNLAKFKKRVKEEITVKDINQYVKDYIGAKKSIYLHEFPRRTKSDWIKLIYIILCQNSKHANYKITGKRREMISLDDNTVHIPYQVVSLKEK